MTTPRLILCACITAGLILCAINHPGYTLAAICIVAAPAAYWLQQARADGREYDDEHDLP